MPSFAGDEVVHVVPCDVVAAASTVVVCHAAFVVGPKGVEKAIVSTCASWGSSSGQIGVPGFGLEDEV